MRASLANPTHTVERTTVLRAPQALLPVRCPWLMNGLPMTPCERCFRGAPCPPAFAPAQTLTAANEPGLSRATALTVSAVHAAQSSIYPPHAAHRGPVGVQPRAWPRVPLQSAVMTAQS